jgi:hypothetical protein
VIVGCDTTNGTVHSSSTAQGDVSSEQYAAVADASSEQDSAVPSPPVNPDMFVITYSTTGCFGSCPVFDVTFDQAGQVEFDGENT